jgi:hypothetical protein
MDNHDNEDEKKEEIENEPKVCLESDAFDVFF